PAKTPRGFVSLRFSRVTGLFSATDSRGLVPAIHAAPLPKTSKFGGSVTPWMNGTSPAMTDVG
ncbi:MAG TPA: hypothetical protein VII20_20470, partial [Roseiarcus sp.]